MSIATRRPGEGRDPYAAAYRLGTVFDDLAKPILPGIMGPGLRRDDDGGCRDDIDVIDSPSNSYKT